MAGPVDIIMLTHNRLAHLEATLDALEARTRAPYRLTIVDNASEPEVRNWLAVNRHRFHQLILRPSNEFLDSLNHGIAATLSDPFMVTDPDLIVPDLEPCWLTRMCGTLERHPDFGVLGIGLDQSNLPPVQEPESIASSEIVDGEIVERPTGSVFCLIRRGALNGPYVTDWETCRSAARAGYRCGWTLGVRAYHLGWDDYRLYPSHLASKLKHGEYREVNLIERAPTLTELALAGPVVAETRRLGVPQASVLELTWGDPAVAAALPATVAATPENPRALPLEAGAAGAVVLVDPPRGIALDVMGEAFRVGARAVVALAPLAAFGSRTAAELAPPGWSGHEAPGPGDVSLALAAGGQADAALSERLGVRTIDDRERWLTMFAAGAFGAGVLRLWIWERDEPLPVPDAVRHDGRLRPRALEVVALRPPRRGPAERLRGRARRELRVAAELARIRALRLGTRAGRSS